MISIIRSNYPDSNLLALKHYLNTRDCQLIVDYIITLANYSFDTPTWADNRLQLTKLHCAHLLARSVLCMNRNQFDCIEIYDKLFDPPKPTQMSGSEFFLFLTQTNSVDPDEMFSLSIQKMDFIFNYFGILLYTESGALTKSVIITRKQHISNIVTGNPLTPISFCNGYMKYSDLIKVDFANKNIGGGVLKKGCCQEEIMFLTNPELIAIMSLVDTLSPTEAILVEGITQYSKANYYGFDLQYAGGYMSSIDQSIIIVDAIDYRNRTTDQYLDENKFTETQKILNGFSMVGSNKLISTGHWGCGAFKGNHLLKFMIQWLGASLSNNKLKYYLGNDSTINGLTIFYDQFKNKTIEDLYNQIMEYTNS